MVQEFKERPLPYCNFGIAKKAERSGHPILIRNPPSPLSLSRAPARYPLASPHWAVHMYDIKRIMGLNSTFPTLANQQPTITYFL
ncbi:hypothetical protein VTI28DRAFT_2797 [Corynascus sepedonium]